ncbi:MAG: PD40 domain-containing protein [Myxococcales bacterium]|nr:PD40 domain-containing protein [Myxococcales bacterium]
MLQLARAKSALQRVSLGLVATLAGACSPGENLECGGGVCEPDTGVSRDLGQDLGADRASLDAPGDAGAPGFDVARLDSPSVSRELVSVSLDPPSAIVVHRNNTAATQSFRVIGRTSDGESVTVQTPTFLMSANRALTLDGAAGAVRTTGNAGGVETLRVEVASGGRTLTASAMIDVRVERALVGPGLLDDVANRFRAGPVSDSARAVVLRYPLDGAVIPSNLAPPDIQWERGSAGDIYRVRLRKTRLELSAYVLHSGNGFRYGWLADRDLWRAVLETDVTDPLRISVDRWDGDRNEVIAGDVVSLEVSRAVLSGSIYFWDLSAGEIERIDAITGERTVAIPSPPPKPDAPDQGSRCIACHTVSRDGRYMAVEMWGGDRAGAVFDLSDANLRSDPAPTVLAPQSDRVWLFSTFSPDSEYLMVNRGTGLTLMRRTEGTPIAGTNLPSMGVAHPEWSPDGQWLAVAAGLTGGWAVDFERSDLAVIPRTGPTTFGAQRIVHRGASPGGTADAHPSFSPDGRWIAFQHGTHSRSSVEVSPGVSQRRPGRLELIAADATEGTARALSRASGDNEGYWPNFSPFFQDGRYWVAFYSRRDYGNAQVGTRGTGRRQIWVTSVRQGAGPEEDPSSVPYWLPGQDARVENISAFWAPVACRMNAQQCTTSSECCSGTCERQANGTFACQPPPPAMCRRAGNTCSQSSDCCEGLMCIANVCGAAPG